MMFWIRSFLFVLILGGLAYYLLSNNEDFLKLIDTESKNSTRVQNDTTTNKKTIVEPPQQTRQPINADNSAAQGLSRFYANLHGGFGDEAKIRNNVVFLPEPNNNLQEILTAKAMVTRPLKRSWRGYTEARPFRKGETLFQKLSDYAEKEGIEVMWWLNRDLIIKDPFRINKELLHTAYMIGHVIQGHFPNGVTSYFCNKQRTIVIIEQDIDFLKEDCMLITPENLKQSTRRR